MIYIKYLDPIVYTGKFNTKEFIEANYKPRVVEAVGFEVDETDEVLFIANNRMDVNTASGKNTFKRVLCVSKKAITEREEIPNNVIEDIKRGIKRVRYVDTQMSGDGVTLTVEKLQDMPKPPVVNLCGFVVKENAENIYLAMERNTDGAYRTVDIIPNIFITSGP